MLSFLAVVFGGVFTIVSSYALGRLLTGRVLLSNTAQLAIGSACLSLAIFFLRLGGWAQLPEFAILGALCLSGFLVRPPKYTTLPRFNPVVLAIVAAFALVYTVYALAPEIQSDPNVYHLKPAVDAESMGGFTDAISFYDRLPQGIENLFAMAYAFGGSSSAKLVHFGFLLATIPLLISVLASVGVPQDIAAIAAAIYFCTPVVGVDGTAGFNDAALVFFTLATIDLLLTDHAALAGVAAGFCYSIKMTGGLVPAFALLFLLGRGRWRAAGMFIAAAGLMIAPWIIRNVVEVGNPFAPVLNAWFPNPYFTISGEQALVASFRDYGLGGWWRLPLELTIYGRTLQGLLGPAFLIAPVALLGLRSKTGRILLALACLLSVPWVLNSGTRFLMPALPFVAAAMIFPLPRAFAMGVLVVHALTSFPASINLYSPEAWHLTGFPVAAALRIESESDYMKRVSWDYNIAQIIESHTPRGSRILDLYGCQPALVDRTIISDWQSITGERLRALLRVAEDITPGVFSDIRAEVPPAQYRAVRIRQVGEPPNWSIQEIELWNGTVRVPPTKTWALTAWPNEWDAGYAFDGNWLSSWSTWQTAGEGMFLEASFDHPMPLSSINVVGLRQDRGSEVEIYVQNPDRQWTKCIASRTPKPGINLRRSATKFLLRSGVRYLLVPTGRAANGPLGATLTETPKDWGVEKIANHQQVYLLKIQ